jgi:O-antigen/teichoic acid export membrane protein
MSRRRSRKSRAARKTSIKITLIICGSALLALPLVAYFFGGFPRTGYDAVFLTVVLSSVAMGFMMVCLGALQETNENVPAISNVVKK